MSTVTDTPSIDGIERVNVYRVLALTGVLTLTASYVAVLRYLTDIVGGSDTIVVEVLVVLAAATVTARYVHEKYAAAITVALAIAGYGYYLVATPGGLDVVVTATDRILADTVALLTGFSVLEMTKASIWAVGFAPAPVFLSWYLALRRRYVLSVIVGGAALSVFVLTGDTVLYELAREFPITLLGAVGGVAAVGFGELDRRGGTVLQADVLVVLFAAMIVVSLTVPVVPGGERSPLFLDASGGYGGASTVEGSLTASPGRLSIQGSIELSPKVRFTVESDEKRYWRVGTYDRFTGLDWVRSGRNSGYKRLPSPPGDTDELEQTFEAESSVATMPAAAQVITVSENFRSRTQVTAHGSLKPRGRLRPGDRYTVTSEVVDASSQELRRAGTDYPGKITEDYLQLPESTPDRVGKKTREIVANASATNPYDRAVAIETWLEENKEYSLQVSRPSGNIADSFLFEMERGYCVYYATSMTVMLRSQGIPARMAVGYTAGQQVDDDRYVVRGLDSHAWVEAYFPEHGWVRFDPTPADPRQDLEYDTVVEARENDTDGVDTVESQEAPLTPTPTPTPEPTTTTTLRAPENQTTRNVDFPEDTTRPPSATIGPGQNTTTAAGGGDGGDGPLPGLPSPSPRQLALGLVALVGAAAGAHRVGATDRLFRAARLRYQGPRGTPDEDVERAAERLELLLEGRYRARREGETPREYFDALSRVGLDDRARRVGEIHERAKYGDGVDREAADEAIDLVDDLVSETTPLLGRR